MLAARSGRAREPCSASRARASPTSSNIPPIAWGKISTILTCWCPLPDPWTSQADKDPMMNGVPISDLDLAVLPIEGAAFAANPNPELDRARAQHPWLARFSHGYVVH